MSQLFRRALLGTTASAAILLAGCLDDGGDQENGDDESEPNGASGSDSGGTGGELETDTSKYHHSGLVDTPSAELFLTPEGVTEALGETSIDEDQWTDIESFADETDFGSASMVHLVAQSPDLCHELQLEAGIQNGTDTDEEHGVVVDASVTDVSADDEACAQQVLTLGALVRVSIGGEPVAEATVTVTDAQGDKHSIGIGVEQGPEDSG